MLKKLWFLLLLGSIGFLLVGQSVFAQDSVSVTIDCNSIFPRHSLAGFLHGNYGYSDNMLRRIAPKYWRDAYISSDSFVKLQRFGIDTSVEFTYEANGDQVAVDSTNADAYRAFVTDRYNKAANAAAIGYTVKYWEFWNEGEGTYVWEPKTHGKTVDKMEREYYAFKVFYDKIRQLQPSAKIVAPSSAYFWPELMDDFLKRCSDDKIRLDTIAWHAISIQPHELPAQVEYVRQLIKKYPSLGTKEIHINEWGWPNIGPGSQMAFFYYLEKSKVDVAAKSIWGYEPLDDLLTPEGRPGTPREPNQPQTRVAYWAWEFYAKMGTTGYLSTPNDNYVVTIASQDKDDPAVIRLIVARATEAKLRSSDPGPPLPFVPPIAPPRDIAVSLLNVPNGEVSVETVSLPANNNALSEEVRNAFVSVAKRTITNGQTTLSFPKVEEERVFLVTIRWDKLKKDR